MSRSLDAIVYDHALPDHANVVIIGGGIVGVSTALSLVERGHSVVLCEKGRIGGEQSSRNWGWVRMSQRELPEIPLALESMKLWDKMNARVQGETGFRRTGVMYAARTRDELDAYASWMPRAREYGIDSRIISGDEAMALANGSTGRFAGALHTPSDGRAEPLKAVPAMATAARRLGAILLGNCAARGLETTAGRVSAVVTERGTIRCDAALLAGGAWSRLFCGNLGIELPQLKIRGSVMRTTAVKDGPKLSIRLPGFALRPQLDGGYTLAHSGAVISEIVPDTLRFGLKYIPTLKARWGDMRLRINGSFLTEWRMKRRWTLDERTPFEDVRSLEPEPIHSFLDEALENCRREFPAFRAAGIAERWGCIIDVSPDTFPILSEVERLPGFHIATGFSGHGFGLGPAAGELMAQIVTGERPNVDPSAFRFDRFASRSVLQRAA
jgi:glycine/D-amino acid oxidase-like deaminating enzyme